MNFDVSSIDIVFDLDGSIALPAMNLINSNAVGRDRGDKRCVSYAFAQRRDLAMIPAELAKHLS